MPQDKDGLRTAQHLNKKLLGQAMVRLSDIRIGTKLFIMSGIAILVVAAIITSQMRGNSSVRSSTELANTQAHIGIDVMSIVASTRGMMVGVRDVRLST